MQAIQDIQECIRDSTSCIIFDRRSKCFMYKTSSRLRLRGVARWIENHLKHDIHRDFNAVHYSVRNKFTGRYQGCRVDAQFTELSQRSITGLLADAAGTNRRKQTYRWSRESAEFLSTRTWIQRFTRVPSKVSLDAVICRIHPLTAKVILALSRSGLVPLLGRVCVGDHRSRFGTATDAIWFDPRTQAVVVVELKKYDHWGCKTPPRGDNSLCKNTPRKHRQKQNIETPSDMSSSGRFNSWSAYQCHQLQLAMTCMLLECHVCHHTHATASLPDTVNGIEGLLVRVSDVTPVECRPLEQWAIDCAAHLLLR
jgi:hypothetical protein